MSLLPGSISNPTFLAYEAVVDRIGSLDLAIVDVYNIDTVPEAALFDLADQFNVLGIRGWTLTETVEQKRNLVKEAIQLHQKAGTPIAIKRAMALVGYPDTTITENPSNRYDGTRQYDGSWLYDGAGFGGFIVTLDPERSQVSSDEVNLIVQLINEWKNKRSYLVDLRIGDISLFTNPLRFDGTWTFDGDEEFDAVRNVV